MKKLILPLLLLLGISMLLAVESAPSDVVGYFKKNIGDGAFQAIALPFAYTDLSVGAVMGDQFGENDAVQDINTGSSTNYFSGFGWFGGLEFMQYGAGYFVNRASGNLATDYYLLGKVDPQALTVTIAGTGAYTGFGLNEAAPVTLTDALFGTNETDGDNIQEIDTGASTAYFDGFGWFGGLESFAPTYAYFYSTAATAPGFTWNYTPTRGSIVQPMLPSRNSK